MKIRTEEDFIKLVKRAEKEAESNLSVYRIKLAFFALVGYFVIIMVLVALLGLAGGLVATAFLRTGLFLLLLKKKLIFVVVPLIWSLLRALWVKITPPQGYMLEREDFPELYAEMDALRKRLKSLKIHKVILDRTLNAAVVQHPRLGILGWNKNYLILGYQLLLTLSPEEMRSVLAHEFGHLSSNHSRFSSWIYRVRLTWLRLMDALDNVESWGGKLMRKFFDWYSPHFEAYSFALARSNEYEADSIAAELTSAEVASSALINVYAVAPYLDQSYWDDYFKCADDNEEPHHAPFEGLVNFLNLNPLTREELKGRIEKEVTVDTHYADTHPSLKDRLGALGVQIQIPSPQKNTAAKAWLGTKYNKIMEDFDKSWLSENIESWKQRYEYVTNARNRLRDFNQTEPSDLNDEDLWNYAYWTHEFENSAAAFPLFRAYQERHPDDPDSAFYIGSTLLEQGDAGGLDKLRLARKNANLLEQATYVGYNFLKEHGNEKEAEAWWQESIDQDQVFVAARKERESIGTKEELTYPQIEDSLLKKLVENLKEQKKVGKVWLAQKPVHHFPESPVYIIAFTPKGISFSVESAQDKVAKSLNVEGDIFVVCKGGNNKSLAKKVIKVGMRIK